MFFIDSLFTGAFFADML